MPKFRDLKRYCERTGWVQVGRGRDHYYYEKVLPNGEILRTKVSHSLSKEIPYHLWQMILKKQLRTTQEEFNKHI
jgi:hypothetical protein